MDSNVDFVQTKRFLRIDTPLGDSALLLTEFEGSEVMSSPFVFKVTFYTKIADERILGLLGKPATLHIGNGPDDPRVFNGLFRKLSGPAVLARGYKTWRAEIVPQAAFMAYTSDCRIFQNKTVVDIITKVLEVHGITRYEFRNLMGHYPALDYCVQYRESALNFISRLMEHFGLYYWFEHEQSGHTLVIADAARAAKPLEPARFVMPDQDQFAAIQTLEADFSFRPGTWTLKDYDFVNPNSPMQASTPTLIDTAPLKDYEIFEFPGSFNDASHGSDISRVRIEQEEAQYHRMRGTGTARDVSPGRQITIAVPDGAGHHTDTKLLLIEAFHHATDLTQLVPASSAPAYANEFTGVPTTYNYRSERVSQKPFVQGVQTARVTGPEGQKIYTDNHGRVKVRFHWDRNPDGDPDQSSSCWLRVSQIWSSGVGGGIQVPRVGEEVIVDFLEGDPDRPIITGRVYNGNNTVPYGLPGNQTQFGFKTQSIPSGGFHELRFEDKAGSEEIFLKSQKDFNRVVLNDETDNIGANATRKITGNLDHTTNGHHTNNTGGNFSDTVAGEVTRTHQSDVTVNTAGAHGEMIGISHTFTVPQATHTIGSMLQTAENWVANHLSTTSIFLGSFSLIGMQTQLIGDSKTIGGANTQLYGMNAQLCALNSSINVFDMSINVLQSDVIQAQLKTAATYLGEKIMNIEAGATAVHTLGIKIVA
jgi:type VI secretion system secreted protein VgrG